MRDKGKKKNGECELEGAGVGWLDVKALKMCGEEGQWEVVHSIFSLGFCKNKIHFHCLFFHLRWNVDYNQPLYLVSLSSK